MSRAWPPASRVRPSNETVWSMVGEEIAAGLRFKGSSPGARSLYG
ncbi:hypothetical protein ACFCWG_26540 [Streptomyces sp. NPDC056390]